MMWVSLAARRRWCVVGSVLGRAFLSLSPGKLLLGAALLWAAGTFLTAHEPTPSVGLVAASSSDAGTDDSGYPDWPVTVGGGQRPAPANNGGQPATRLDGQVATLATANSARSLAELRSRYAESVATPAPRWPLPLGHPGGRPTAAPQSGSDPDLLTGLSQPRPRPGASGSSGRVPPPAQVEDLFAGVVDLASGIVTKVAGERAGTRVREALTDVTDQVTKALTPGGKPRPPSRESAFSAPRVGTLGTASRRSGPTESTFSAHRANLEQPAAGLLDPGDSRRLEPGNARQGGQQSAGRTADLTGASPERPEAAGRPAGLTGTSPERPEAAGRPAESTDAGQGRPAESTGAGQGRPGADLAAQITKLTTGFVSDLLQLLGVGGPNGGSQAQQTPPDSRLGEAIDKSVQSYLADLFGELGSSPPAGPGRPQPAAPAGPDVPAALGGYGPTVAGSGGAAGAGSGGHSGGGTPPGRSEQGRLNCANQGMCEQANGPSALPGSASSRGPPELLAEDSGDAADTQQALNNRLAAVKAQKGLKAAKQQLDDGKITKAAYQKKVSAQKALQTKADDAAAQLDPDDAQLINNVVTGQRQLAGSQAKLDTAKKQLAAGKITKAAYNKRADAFEEQQERVYQQSSELRAATGQTARNAASLGKNGSGAACGRTGAFTTCSTVATDKKTGKQTRDDCIGLAGISGCAAHSGKGAITATAKCTVKGCGVDAAYGKRVSHGKCGAGPCNLGAGADAKQVSYYCQARNGCAGDGRLPTRKNTVTTTGKCTRDCALNGAATARAATADCQSRNGHCLGHSTGQLAAQASTPKAGAAQAGTPKANTAKTGSAKKKTGTWRGAGEAKAECAAEHTGCDTSTTLTLPNSMNEPFHAAAMVNCTDPACTGKAATHTDGKVTAKKVRASKSDSDCQVHGAGGGCGATSDTEFQLRNGGWVSRSHGDAGVRCTDSTRCGGQAHAATAALDTAVSRHWRGTSAKADCTVRGGGCAGDARSDASSAPEYLRIDPATGKPAKGQPTRGPSSSSSSSASLDCRTSACDGRVHTETAAWDGAIDHGKPRTSEGVARCQAGGGECADVRSASVAYTGSGAARDFYAEDQVPNAKRLVAGPSAASVAGAELACDGTTRCTGKVVTRATGVNPAVSNQARGSTGQGVCSGVTGGTCRAVSNSAASTGPDASSMAPAVRATSTDNATVTSQPTGGKATGTDGKATSNGRRQGDRPNQGAPGQDQPTTPPDKAPGSSSAGSAPSVRGASSWSAAQATLNCPGGGQPCRGKATSEATGDTGGRVDRGGKGTRGPPGKGTATSSGSCTATQSGCQGQSTSTAGAGQVVADMIRGRSKATPTLAQSEAGAQCAGPGCTARTTGRTAGTPGKATTNGHCTAAANGCAVISSATASTTDNAGRAKSKHQIPGVTGNAQATSQLSCPDVGCKGRITGKTTATGGRSHTVGNGATRCDGTKPCQAQLVATASVIRARGANPAERFTTTSGDVMVTCDNGTKKGCPTRATNRTTAQGAQAVKARATSRCATAGACQAGTGGFTAPDVAEVNASCGGTKCRTKTIGNARAGANQARSRTACVGGPDGRCAGASRVGATANSAQTSASCQGTKGSTCTRSFSARSSASASAPGAQADAGASCHGKGGSGRDWCTTSAQASASRLPDGAAANASASCQGSKGAHCQRHYRAHAVADDSYFLAPTYDSWGGKGTAHGEGTCSGGGGAGSGGCGVQAHAKAGPNGYGTATCSGDCSHFVNASTGNHYTPLAPIPRPVVTTTGGGKDGKDNEQKLGKKENSINIGCALLRGNYACLGSSTESGTIQNCTQGCTIKGKGGEQATRDPRTGTSYGTTPGGNRVEGSRGVQVNRYQHGYTGRSYGRGSSYDGRTGSHSTYRGGTNSTTFSNGKGVRYSTTCNGGCKGALRNSKGVTDYFDIKKPNATGVLTARGDNGAPAYGNWTGKGTVTTAEGDKLDLKRGRADFATRNAAGLGGHLTISRDGKIRGLGTVHSAEGVDLDCRDCDTATHYMPTEKGKGGVNVCQVSAPGSGCTGFGAPLKNGQRDHQWAFAGKKGAAEFVQFLRNKDGSGGGAVGFSMGTGHADGRDAYGNWIKAGGNHGGMYLLYAERDGYQAGQGCAGGKGTWCQGSDPKDRRLPWVQPTKEVTKALGLYGPGWGKEKERPYPGFIGPMPLERNGSDTLLDRARAVFAYGGAKSHQRWWLEQGGRRLAPVMGEVGKALAAAKGQDLSPAQMKRLAKRVDPKLIARAMDVEGDVRTAGLVDAVAPRGPAYQGADDKRRLAQNPWLVDRLSRDGKGNPLPGGYRFDPNKKPTEQQLNLARTNLLNQQQQLRALQPERDAQNAAIAAYEKKRKDCEGGKGSCKGLEAKRQGLLKNARELQKREAPILAALRAHDLTTATVSGDRTTAGGIGVAAQNLEVANRLADAIPEPHTKAERAAAKKLAGLVDAVGANYEAAIRAPRAPTSKLHDLGMPSTLSPDLPLSLRAAEGYAFFHRTATFTGGARNPLEGMTPDQVSYWASTWNASGKQWVWDPKAGVPRRVTPTDLAYMPATPRTSDEATTALIGAPYSPWFKDMKKSVFKPINAGGDGKPIKGGETLLDVAGATLSPSEMSKFKEQARVHGFVNLVKGFPEFLSDGWHIFGKHYVMGGYDALFGSGTDNWVRNSGRTAVGFAFTWGTRWVSLAIDGPIEIGNMVKNRSLGTGSEPKLTNPLGETTEDGLAHYTRLHPFTGTFVAAPARETWNLATGGWDHFVNEFKHDPLATGLTAGLPLMIAGGGAKKGFEARAAGAWGRVETARMAGMPERASALETRARRYDLAARIANVPYQVGYAPVRATHLPVQLAAGAVRAGAILATKGLGAAAGAAAWRGLGGAIGNRGGEGWDKASLRLDRAAQGAARAAESARMVARYGPGGAKRLTGAYNRLGVRPSAGGKAVEDAYRAKAARIDQRQAAREAAGKPADPVLTARRAALGQAVRAIRADRAVRAAKFYTKEARQAARTARTAETRAAEAAAEAKLREGDAATARTEQVAAERAATKARQLANDAANRARAAANRAAQLADNPAADPARVAAKAAAADAAQTKAREAERAAEAARARAEGAAETADALQGPAAEARGRADAAAEAAHRAAGPAREAVEWAGRVTEAATELAERPADRPLIGRIDDEMRATGGREGISTRELAERLETTEARIREAVEGDADTGPARYALVGDGGPGRVRPVRRAPGDDQPGRPGDGLPPSSSSATQAGGGHDSGGWADGPSGAERPGGPAERPASGSKAKPRRYDGSTSSRDPPEKPKPEDIQAPRTRGELKRDLARERAEAGQRLAGVRETLAKADRRLAEAERERDALRERLRRELADPRTDRARRAELREAATRAKSPIGRAEQRVRALEERYAKLAAQAEKAAGEVERARRDFKNRRELHVRERMLHEFKTAWAELDGRAWREKLAQVEAGEFLTPLDYFVLSAEAVRLAGQKVVYDEQALGAMLADSRRSWAGARGTVIEQATGEGKTLTGYLITFRRAMEARAEDPSRRGVHVMTTSAELAARDAEAARKIARKLGLTVEVRRDIEAPLERRRAAYEADVTYGAVSGFVFDFLNDQRSEPGRRVQRGRGFALVDEADMVMLDDAGTPHRLARSIDAAVRDQELAWARGTAWGLRKGEYGADLTIGRRQALRISDRLGTHLSERQVADLENALRADRLYRLNRHYKIADGSRIEILDNPHGRALAGRRWSRGLHEAIEAKHDLPVRQPQRTIAGTTIVDYLGGYHQVAGMTGTALEGRGLFWELYRLDVVELPRHFADRLQTRPTRLYASEGVWLNALADQVVARRSSPAPELLIFRTPAEAERFAALLISRGIRPNVLNALDHRSGPAHEKAVIDAAGRPHAVTVATNLIGRGVDIALGGGDPAAAALVRRHGGLRVTMGSLFESRRATRQGFGRAARQGEPGIGAEVLSLADPILLAHLKPRELEAARAQAHPDGRVAARVADQLVAKAKKRAERAGARRLRDTVYGRIAPETEIVHGLDAGTTGARARGREAAPDRWTRANLERIGELEGALAAARRNLADAEQRFLRGELGEDGVFAAADQLLQRQAELTRAVTTHRRLTPHPTPTQDPEFNRRATQALIQSPQHTDSVTPARRFSRFSTVIQSPQHGDSVTPAEAHMAEARVAEMQAELAGIAAGAGVIARFGGAHAGAGALIQATAEQAAAAGQHRAAARQAAADQHRAGADQHRAGADQPRASADQPRAAARQATADPGFDTGPERRAFELAVIRLEALLAALPAEAAGDAMAALLDPDARAQVQRLHGLDAPDQLVADLYLLAANGRVHAEELRRLFEAAQPGSDPDGPVDEFAERHGLDWEVPDKLRLRAALARMEPEPVSGDAGHHDTGHHDTRHPRDPAWAAGGSGSGGGGGGGVAKHPLDDGQRDLVAEKLRTSRAKRTPLEEFHLDMPRGPPGVRVEIWDGEFPVPGVVAFGWADRGVVVVTRAVAERVAARYASDRLRTQRWWKRLLEHERDFHLGENPRHSGTEHDADAAPIAARWFNWNGEHRTAGRVAAATGAVMVAGVALGFLPQTDAAAGVPQPTRVTQPAPNPAPKPTVGKPVRFTGAEHDRVGTALNAIRVVDADGHVRKVTIAELNRFNHDRFRNRHQSIAGERVYTPSNWTGVWVAQPGDYYWRIWVERFHNRPGYVRAIAGKANPDQMETGNRQTVRKPPPVKQPPKQQQQPQPKQPTASPKPTASPNGQHQRPRNRGPPGAALFVALGVALAVLAGVIVALAKTGQPRLGAGLRWVTDRARTPAGAAVLGGAVLAAGVATTAVLAGPAAAAAALAGAVGLGVGAVLLRLSQAQGRLAQDLRRAARAVAGLGVVASAVAAGVWLPSVTISGPPSLETVLRIGAGVLLVVAAGRGLWDLWQERNTPILPGQRRTWLAAGSLFGLGLGATLMAMGAPGVWEAFGFALLVASAGAAAKVVWSVKWYRKDRAGQMATGWRVARVATAAGLIVVALTGVVAGSVVPWLPEWLGFLIDWVGQQKKGVTTALLVISAIVISAPLNHRYIKYRKIWNLAKGTFTRPQKNALFGAFLAAIPAIANNLVQLSAVAALVALFAQYNWAAAAVVAFFGTFFQRRQMGGQLTWNAGSDAVYAVPITFLLAALHWTQPTTSWAEYLTAIGWWVAAVAPAAMLIDYWIYYFALPVEKLSRLTQKRSRHVARQIRAGIPRPATDRMVAKLRKRIHRVLDFETFSHPNWMVSFWKSPDSITKAVLTYFIVRPIPGLPENAYTITLRILISIGVLALSWRIRNRIELRLGILGYLSPSSMARRSRPIGWFWRLTRRADAHPRWFWRLLGHQPYPHRVAGFLGVPEADLTGDPGLPATLAERLVESLLHDLPPPVELRRLATDHPGLNRQVTRVEGQWSLVDEKARRALSLALLLVATNREALTGAAGRIDGRVGDVVAFVGGLADALPGIFDSLALTDADRERLGLGSGAPLSRTVLEKLLLDAVKQMYAQRLVYLRDHLLPLLYAWRGELPRASEEENRAEMWILYTEGEMELAARPKIDPRGFVAARNLLADQNERVRENRRIEQVRLTVEGDPAAKQAASDRIDLYRRNSDALLILDTSLAVLEEVELHRMERAYWRYRLTLAVGAATPAPPENTLLAVLLTAAGRSAPLTARDLADRYQGPAAGWQRMLNDLARAGLVTGNATDGYTVTDELRDAWRAARPKLRHALRANPAALPGAERLRPLMQRTSWGTGGTKRAHDALLDLLAMGHQVLYQRADPGFAEAVRRRWQAAYGRYYQHRNPLSAAEQAPRLGRKDRRKQLTGAVEELTNAIEFVEGLAEEALRAEFAVKRLLHELDPNRHLAGRPDLRATDPQRVFDAKSEFDRISQELERAYQELRKIVDRIRDEDYPHVGARPPKLSILVEEADHLLALGSGQIAPVPAEIELRRSLEALDAADRALDRAGTPEEREAALHQARVALIRFRYAARTIREKGATIRLRAWRHVREGEERARELIEHDRPELVPAFALPTGHETVEAGTGGRITLALPGDAAAALSDPGTMPHARNQDYVEAHHDPVTGVITVVVADGLSAGTRSELAARLAVRTALAELTRTDREDRTPEQAHRFAAAMAAARVAAMAQPDQPYPPATTYLAVQVFPGKGKTNLVVVSNLGDTHAYIERNGKIVKTLTRDHTNPVTGGLTGFLGENPLLPPHVDTYRPRKAAHVLLATDGLHIHDLAKLVKDAAFAPDDTPAERVRRLIEAGRAAGGRDNLTVADIPLPARRPGPGPLADQGMTDGQVRKLDRAMPELKREARAEGVEPAPFMARGPPVPVPGAEPGARPVPVLLLDPVAARPVLERHGLDSELTERLVAFAWFDPELGPVIVMFAPRATELAGLHAQQGRAVELWWDRVVAHELGHLDGHWHAAGHEAHDDDANDLLDQLDALRADALRVVGFDRATGRPAELDTATLADLYRLLERLAAQGLTSSNRPHLAKASPAGEWERLGLDYRQVTGDVEIQRLLADHGYASVTVVYLVDLPRRQVIVGLRTSGDVLDARASERARGVLEQVVSEQVADPAAGPAQLWRDRDPAGVLAGLLLGRLGIWATTRLNTWEYVLGDLVAEGASADPEMTGKARRNLADVADFLAEVGTFLDRSGATGLDALRDGHGEAAARLAGLRGQLAEVIRALGGDGALGGPSRLSHGDAGRWQRIQLVHLLARLPVAERLAATDPGLTALSRHGPAAWRDSDALGLRALPGLIEATQALGLPDLVIWASADGWLYTDVLVLAALRDGALDDAARAQLFEHELLHRSAPGVSEAQNRELAPLPDFEGLRHLFEPAPPGAPGLLAVRDEFGRPAWQDPVFGSVAPNLLSRVVRVVVDAPDGRQHFASGLLWSADGRTGQVLTNWHAARISGARWVEISTPGGVRRVRVHVPLWPTPEEIEARLIANRATGGLRGEQLRRAATELDLAVMRIPESRVLAPLELDTDEDEPRLVAMGFPWRRLPVRLAGGGTRSLDTEARHLIVSAAVRRERPARQLRPVRLLNLFFDAEWPSGGNSGGPLVNAATGRVAGLYQGRLKGGQREKTAIGPGAIRSYLEAHFGGEPR